MASKLARTASSNSGAGPVPVLTLGEVRAALTRLLEAVSGLHELAQHEFGVR